MNRVDFRKNRQTNKLLTLFFVLLLVSLQSCGQENESNTRQSKKEDYLKNVDYTIRTDIINPDTLQGDQKKIFWHSFFVKLSHEEIKSLKPVKVKEEFAKLGITTDQRARFVDAYSFFITYYRGHKKDCEYFAYFEFLKPESKN